MQVFHSLDIRFLWEGWSNKLRKGLNQLEIQIFIAFLKILPAFQPVVTERVFTDYNVLKKFLIPVKRPLYFNSPV